MKITKRQLRKIIRETLLREGVKEDALAYYGEIADIHSDSDAMDDLLGDLTDADLVAAGWEGGKDEVENYEDDPMMVIDSLTPETLDRLVKTMKTMGPQDLGDDYNEDEGPPYDLYADVPVWSKVPRNSMGHKPEWLERMAHIVQDVFGGGVMYDMGMKAGIKIEPSKADIEYLRPEWEPYWPDAKVTGTDVYGVPSITISGRGQVEAAAHLHREQHGSLK